MKVYLKALNEQGEKVLTDLANNWENRESHRLLSMMKDRVSFDIVSINPVIVQFYQIDFVNLPNNNKARRRITANVFHKLKEIGITESNTEIVFNE